MIKYDNNDALAEKCYFIMLVKVGLKKCILISYGQVL